jgi:integration host factor subunit alpha
VNAYRARRERARHWFDSRSKISYRIHYLAATWGATVTKADIIESVYEKVGFSKKEAAEIVEMVFDTIKETLERGEKIKISGFGNFIVRDKKSRVGRNPQTGEEIEISARRVLTFRPSQVLKNALNLSAEAAAAGSTSSSGA